MTKRRQRKDEMNDPNRLLWYVFDYRVKNYRTVYTYEEYLDCFPADKRPEHVKVAPPQENRG
jgi:hypothetical protein